MTALTQAQELHRLVDIKVDAAISTGNPDEAITVLIEYAEYFPVHAREIAAQHTSLPTIDWPVI